MSGVYNIASIDMRDIGKQEDVLAKSGKNLPYPLDTVVDFIAKAGANLINAQGLIETSLRKNDVSLPKGQKKVLKDANQNIKSSLGNVERAAKAIKTI